MAVNAKLDQTQPRAYCTTCDDEVNVKLSTASATHHCIHCGSAIEEIFVVIK
jgi:predicted RNA-binding Zn-ribbon protein involved in translation (DUF1610 family)